MSVFVVDANVVAKWLTPEDHSQAAERLLGGHTLLAPDIAIGEVANLLVKKVRQRQFPAERVQAGLDLALEQLVLVPSLPLVGRSTDIALRYARSVFDALYLTLAEGSSCQCVTADRRAYDALVADFGAHLLWIEDVP